MKVEQLYTGCLAQGAYYIESNGEAAIIDPLREVTPYIEMAEKRNAKIKYVLETHFHADFVSGHLDLAKRTGAKIVYGPTAQPNFEAYVAKDMEELPLGNVKIRVLHTPGHTMESSVYLLLDENGKEYAIFSGDTLFLGDVGRPDLAVKTDLTKEQLASYLYDSIHSKILTLPDHVIVYPGHGAGSACGKNMMKETVDTLGNQKIINYALRKDMSREEFIEAVLEGQTPPPAYFPKNAMMNKMGYDSIDEVLRRGLQALDPDAFEMAANEYGALVLDTRDPNVFVKAFIPNSINIAIDGNFAPWVGALITDIKQPILIVADPGREEEVVTRLARVGYDYSIGFLKGGFEAWKNAGKQIDVIHSIPAEIFEKYYHEHEGIEVIDVRRPSEYAASHVAGAKNLPLDFINDNMSKFRKDKTMYLHCAGGYRSVIAASILKARGYDNLVNVEGGYSAISQTSVKKISLNTQHA